MVCKGFNTSHVTLYRRRFDCFCCGLCVSIHLMLLFIQRPVYVIGTSSSFNTSHVTLYPISDFASRYAQRSFNTSHVTLYRDFKMLPQSEDFRFNTSHVTLYLDSVLEENKYLPMFQYISCYSLSIFPMYTGFVRMFQYISCYSLSCRSNNLRIGICFNTSHVTLYRYQHG